MRFLNGLVLGVLLTVGVAYWHDRNVSTEPDGTARQIVNWDEFGRVASDAGTWLQTQIGHLGQSLRRG